MNTSTLKIAEIASKPTRYETKSRVAAVHHAAEKPAAERPRSLRIRKVLVPVDFSEEGKSAVEYAQSFAKLVGASVLLLHVVEPIYYSGEMSYIAVDTSQIRKRAQDDLRALRNGMPSGVQVDVRVQDGVPFQEIVDTARKAHADMIIMSTHGYTGLRHVLLGSTAERVVRHASCPVLVVRSTLAA